MKWYPVCTVSGWVVWRSPGAVGTENQGSPLGGRKFWILFYLIKVLVIFTMIICLPSQMIPKIIDWFNTPKCWYTYRNTKKSTSPELLPNVPELLPRKSVDTLSDLYTSNNPLTDILNLVQDINIMHVQDISIFFKTHSEIFSRLHIWLVFIQDTGRKCYQNTCYFSRNMWHFEEPSWKCILATWSNVLKGYLERCLEDTMYWKFSVVQ